jgi:hypothetical protein
LEQAVPTPRNRPDWAVQVASVARTQEPSGRQQAPVSEELRQMEAVQAVPGPRQTPLSEAHWDWEVTWQTVAPVAGSGKQQAPAGVVVGQVPGAQVVLGPWKVPP